MVVLSFSYISIRGVFLRNDDEHYLLVNQMYGCLIFEAVEVVSRRD